MVARQNAEQNCALELRRIARPNCALASIHLRPSASKQTGIAACADGHPPSGIGRGFAAIAVQPLVPARSTVVPSITVAPAESGDGHADEYAAIFHRSEVCEKYLW